MSELLPSGSPQPPAPPEIGKGTRPTPPERLEHPLLREYGRPVAEITTGLFYSTWPWLLERYGQRGREHAHEDNFWHLASMDAALQLDAPKIFLDYVAWLRAFLGSRGMGDDIVAANFVFFRRAFAGLSLPPEQNDARAPVLALLDQAIETFPEASRTPPGPANQAG